jgi:hypothetical protein
MNRNVGGQARQRRFGSNVRGKLLQFVASRELAARYAGLERRLRLIARRAWRLDSLFSALLPGLKARPHEETQCRLAETSR